MARRPEELPVGLGDPNIPYDRSGMPEGMTGIPSPGGAMKKMSLEFVDPTQAAATQQPQIPPGAGAPPAGMQAPIPPAGMQAPQQGGASPLLAGMGQPQQAPDTGQFSDEQLQQMLSLPQEGMDQGMDPGMGGDPMADMGQFDPMAGQAEQMFNQGMEDPQIQQQLLLAARRQLGGGGF
jgi:hypothetical protein